MLHLNFSAARTQLSFYAQCSAHFNVFWPSSRARFCEDRRSQILAQFAAASFVIAEIMKGRLTGDKLSWRPTKFKLVAYVSYLLGSNNVRFNLLGEGMKEMLNIAGPYLNS